MTRMRQYDDDSTTIRWKECENAIVRRRQYDSAMTTLRQYDGDSAIVRWRQCENVRTRECDDENVTIR
ncbi:hypothetical protein DPMN_001812 [Dreissena polymorpha]|uniref:Uncharacterized protein n=1 Tax=Dreissena polymorpha TaxID=45954 RepID=A0A9D4MME6_DREPO|nr:hypothetical protein DPMN_001812 [Dreissena polymorpha]